MFSNRISPSVRNKSRLVHESRRHLMLGVSHICLAERSFEPFSLLVYSEHVPSKRALPPPENEPNFGMHLTTLYSLTFYCTPSLSQLASLSACCSPQKPSAISANENSSVLKFWTSPFQHLFFSPSKGAPSSCYFSWLVEFCPLAMYFPVMWCSRNVKPRRRHLPGAALDLSLSYMSYDCKDSGSLCALGVLIRLIYWELSLQTAQTVSRLNRSNRAERIIVNQSSRPHKVAHNTVRFHTLVHEHSQ
jgi:hypothetical protein